MNPLLGGILDWLLEIAKLAVPAVVTIITYRKMTASQDPKLQNIETLVNGDRQAKEQRIKDLEAKLREHGVDG